MNIHPQINSLVLAEEDAMIAFRRELHMHPEIAFEESWTTARIAKELDKIGIPYRLTTPTGIIADINGELTKGKKIALRADMDALPVEELNTDLPYCSKMTGKMHACGHDAHSAMLVAAAKVLYSLKENLPGSVRLIFQPAEEVGQGANSMIAQGALDNVDAVFSSHVWSQALTGEISCREGAVFAGAEVFKIRFKGRGGHGGLPHDAIDAVMVAAAFVTLLQSIVAREINPIEPAVITVGKLVAGTRFNVIAEEAVLEGTVRYFSVEMQQKLKDLIYHYAQQSAKLYGADVEIDYFHGPLPVINETNSAKLAEKLVNQALSPNVRLYNEKPLMLAEDFSAYGKAIPAVFALIGCHSPLKEKKQAHHHGSFNVDEAALKYGAQLYAHYAWSYLHTVR